MFSSGCKSLSRYDRKGEHLEIKFVFLGYTSQPRRLNNRRGNSSSTLCQTIRGWINYYGHFYKSQLYLTTPYHMNSLVVWARRKYKKLERHKTRAIQWLGRLAKKVPELFAHWRLGILPAAG
ncbi:group II intron maturase-specific domain-containing protein [Paenibacillus solani]|uniref:group II intron maturase-specific domain-containing protein n=1 Tax=Paenibacillus solani TaxID=1705565 RepID=UPI0009E87B7C|nr:group II intron maturase-specific domain-containing protein [Paenibacillus solani]